MDESLVSALGKSVLHMRRVGASLSAQMDVSMMELRALTSLQHNHADSDCNVFAQDLVEDLRASKAAVSQMLTALEKRGYIERGFNPTNRRKIIVTLTDRGDQVVMQAQQFFQNALRGVIEEFGEDNARTLVGLIGRLSEIIDRRAQEQQATDGK